MRHGGTGGRGDGATVREARVAPSPRPPVPPLLGHARVGLDWLLKMHPTPEELLEQENEGYYNQFRRFAELY